ncbi:MAG: hypothetical protein DRQ65_08515 [Gammaproteobacteria bacterium]|nr:MAG: hypothetical protein DRQ65_08515 [Gammaproteobacteria bacterium]RLA51919.1 MAG: hypothetical protein DRQ98_10925 [Gammaproteobacteria bacterium]HDY82543.1 hypothetical protein [Halieaceae bacterium]
MQRSYNVTEGSQSSEMAIVDTFTKLIFGEEDGYSASELQIIQAFRAADANVLLDSHRDMGEYLRALGVREMIEMVSLVREQLLRGMDSLIDPSARHNHPDQVSESHPVGSGLDL